LTILKRPGGIRKVVWEKCIQKREGTVRPDELCAIERKRTRETEKP
jgi:hypothetical protein